jgi:hypothetical protein
MQGPSFLLYPLSDLAINRIKVLSNPGNELPGRMKKSTRSKLITAITLLAVFVVMVAALAYNPAKGDITTVHIFGIVTDEHGTPLSDATVVFQQAGQGIMGTMMDNKASMETDDRGQYSIVLDSDHFGMPGILTCVAFTSMDSRWIQGKNITVGGGQSEFDLDFTLVNNTILILPVGPMVLASTQPGLTQVTISTYLAESGRCHFVQSSHGGANSFGNNNVSFTVISEKASMTFEALSGYIGGSYYDNPTSIANTEYWHLGEHADKNGQPIIVNETFGQDYIDPDEVASRSEYYDLDLGENVTISISPKNNVTLPEALWPKVSLDLLGLKLDSTINCTYSNTYRNMDVYVTDFNTSASVTITPLTAGTHHYQVYIEQDYIIHVWELTNNPN